MDPRQRLSSPAVTVCSVIALAASVGLAALATGAAGGLENGSVNLRFALRGSVAANDVVVVGIDDATFNRLGLQWPFPRRDHAVVIDHLLAAGARLIAFDVQFTEPTDPGDDNALIQAIARAHNMVLATDAVAAHGQTDVLGGNAVLQQVGARAADSTVVNDSGGVLRDMRQSYQGIDTFGVAIASSASGHEISPKLFGGAEHPVPIDYAGPPGTVASIPYWRVYADKFPAAEVRGKIVIVGYDASPEAQAAIKAGSMYGDAIQHPDQIGAKTIDAIADSFAGKAVPAKISVPVGTFTKADAK